MSTNFDLNKDPVKLVNELIERGVEDQSQIFTRFQRLDHLWRNHRDLSKADPFKANPMAAFAHANIEILSSRYVKALLGRSPYIPLIALNKDFQDQAERHEEALDSLNTHGEFYIAAAQAIKQMLVYGTSFIEPLATFDFIEVDEPTVVSRNGDAPEFTDKPQTVRRFRLVYKAWHPGRIIVDPYATTLKDARYIIKISTTTKRELKRMARLSAFGDDFDMKALDKAGPGSGATTQHDEVRKLRQSIGLTEPMTDDDVGVFLELESPEKYIAVWDFTTKLYTKDNPHKHGRINLAQFVNNTDPNTANQFWGVSVIKPHESMHALYDMTLGIIIDNHNLANNRTWLINKGKISLSDITMGGLIEADVGFGEKLSDTLIPVPHVPLSNEFFALPRMIQGLLEIGYGIAGQDQQQPSGVTATEIADLREQSNTRMEFGLKMLERGFGDIAHLAMSHMAQYMAQDDWTDLLGLVRASDDQFPFKNAHKIPGGCVCAFKASERFAQQVVLRRNLTELTPFVQASPNVKQDVWFKRVLEAYDMSQHDIKELLRSDEEAQQIQAQQSQEAQQQELGTHIETRRASAAVGRENKTIEIATGLRKPPNEEAQTTTQAKVKRS